MTARDVTPRPLRCVALAFLLVGCGEPPGDLVELADALQADGDYASSLIHLREAQRHAPGDAEIAYRIGLGLLHTGRPGAAVWPLLRASESSEHAKEAGTLLARVLLETGNPEAAVDRLDPALASAADDPTLLQLRAAARLTAKEPAAALADADRALAAEPGDPPALEVRARALLELERNDEARAAFEMLAAATSDGEPPWAARGCLLLASFHARVEPAGDAAIESALDCAVRFPDDRQALDLASGLLDRAGRHDRATRLWRDALARYPDDTALQSQLAYRLERAGEQQEAESLWLEMARDRDTAAAHRLLAAYYRRQGRADEARRSLARAIDLAGDAPADLPFEMADLLIDQGELEAAAAMLPEVGDPALAELLRGRLALAQGSPSTALAALEQGLLVWPDHAGARVLAAQAAARIGDADRAVSEYRAAFRARRSDPAPALAAARLHLALGDPASALGLVRVLLGGRLDAGPEPYLLAARAHTDLGEFDRARRALLPLEAMPEAAVSLLLERARIARVESGARAAVTRIEQAALDTNAVENEAVLTALVELYAEAGDVENALASLQHAGGTAERASLHALRGRILLRAGREREAGDAFRRARTLDPRLAAPSVGLAVLALRESNLRMAASHVDRALAVGALDPPTRYGAAEVLRILGRTEEAASQLEAVVRDDPGHARACSDLARLLLELDGDLERASRLAERAARLSPGDETSRTVELVAQRREAAGGSRRIE